MKLPEPGTPNPEFERPADRSRLEAVARALEERGFVPEIVEDGAEARARVLELIPEGAEVHAALSETLAVLGITSEIDESGRYDSVRGRLRAMDRNTQRREMRKAGAAPDYMLGSVHAVTEGGEILVASGSGSQLGAYGYAAGSVVLVVGHQKVVRDLDEGWRRIREYCLPREFQRMQEAGRAGTVWAETLALHYDPRHRIRVILVPETLGF